MASPIGSAAFLKARQTLYHGANMMFDGTFLRRPASDEKIPVCSVDDEIIERTLRGDTAAFGELVARHERRLLAMLGHLTGCGSEAEDVAQDAFLQAYLKLADFKRESQFYTWLYRIAVNGVLSKRRRIHRERPMPTIDGYEMPVPDTSEGPTVAVERAERVAEVRAALDSLPDDFRSVLVLRELDGCNYEQISELLGLPPGTVRSRIHRGRAALREAIVALDPSRETDNADLDEIP